ncbi:MAG: ATP-binding protein [Gammaproteobacteria bacterium]|nr:ATP-binding protein [Gammaproteobacteria bacterium]
MMTAVLWATLNHSEDAIREQFASNERAMLEVMGGISHIALLTGEYSELQPYLENLLQDSRIEQVMLVDHRGIVVAATRPDSIGRFPATFSTAVTIDPETQARKIWISKNIKNEERLLGVLAIELSDAALVAATADSGKLGVSIAVTGMILIAFVGLIVGSLLTWRLAVVTDAANRFAEGDATARTGFRGDDEISDLGRTFDKMAGSLQASAEESNRLIDQLSEKNVELEQFAYTVSHDLKSPLVTVKGYVGMLQKDLRADECERVEQDLEYIVAATDTMGLLLEDLLELSRVGRIVNESEKVSLTELFEAVAASMHLQIASRDADLTVQAQMPAVLVDRQRMAEVVQNLLENALKFSSKSSPPTIEISARVEDDKVVCCVADNGIGIEPEFQEQIFGLFNRLNLSYEGTGIGLALVKRIIEVHQGSVWVESTGNGDGARFCFALPAIQQAA